MSDQQAEQIPWKEIFGVEDDDGTVIESVKLKHVGVVGLQESLASELVECFVAKPSIVNVGFHQAAASVAHSKFDIMPVCFSWSACTLFRARECTSLAVRAIYRAQALRLPAQPGNY